MSRSTIIDNPLFGSFGGESIPIVTPKEVREAKATYFQACILHAGGWVPISGEKDGKRIYIQIRQCQLRQMPIKTKLVMDLLVRENEAEERHYFDNALVGCEIREGNYVFFASQKIPTHIVVGLRLESEVDGSTIIPPEEDVLTKPEEY